MYQAAPVLHNTDLEDLLKQGFLGPSAKISDLVALKEA